ncbi:cysteine hydrolase [Mycolicibacterium sp. A43C]
MKITETKSASLEDISVLVESVWRSLSRTRRMSTPPSAAIEPRIGAARSIARSASWDSDSYEGGPVAPNECALLVLGCQPEILAAIPQHDELIARINKVVDIVRIHEGIVVHARLAFDPMDYRFPPLTNKEFGTVVQEHQLRNGTPGADLHPALSVRQEDIELRTTRLGVFSTTKLDEQLTNYGVTTLIVTGCHTSGAVLTTIREAADRDYRIIVVAGCTADPDSEVLDFLLERVFARQVEIWSAAQLYSSMAANK